MGADRAGGAEPEGPPVAGLAEAFKARRARIGVIGLGYVGIPLALAAVRAGFRVLGFDIDAPRVEQLNRGESLIRHIRTEDLAEAMTRRIGQELYLAEKTVKNYVSALLRKLGMQRRTQAAVYAVERTRKPPP